MHLLLPEMRKKKIEFTLKSLNFADEIVVILDRSIDKTKKICARYTKKIYEGSWKSEGKRRNFGISKCRSEWILEIDADELVTKPLEKEIVQKLTFNNFDFYVFERAFRFLIRQFSVFSFLFPLFILFSNKDAAYMSSNLQMEARVTNFIMTSSKLLRLVK